MLDFDKIKVYGRNGETACVAADWTASGIEFSAECEGDIYITVHTASAQKLYFSSFINGERKRLCAQDFPSTAACEYRIPIATELKKGKYNIKFLRQSEAERGPAEITDIELCGVFLPRPALRETLIEFIGDSITCGYANLATCDMDPALCSESPYEDGTDAYAYLTAEALNADFSILSRQGTGIVAGWDYLTNPMGAIPKVYHLTSFYRGAAEYKPSRKADIVVINLGTNDIYKFLSNEREPSLSQDDFINTIYDFFCKIYDLNDSPRMVVAVGMMTNEQNHAPLYRWYREAIRRFKETRGEEILFCSLPENYEGGKAHPAVVGHHAAAKVLTEFIKANINI